MGHARSADYRPGSCCAGGGNSRRGPALGASARGGQRRGMRVDKRSILGGSADGRLRLQHLTQIVKPGASDSRLVALVDSALQAADETGRWRRESKTRRFGESTLAHRHFGICAACDCMGDLFGAGGPTLSQACVDV